MAKYEAEKNTLKAFSSRKNNNNEDLEKKEAARIKGNELLIYAENIRRQQKRLYKDSLKWLYEDICGVVSVLAEVERELYEGDLLIYNALELFKSDVSEAEYKETVYQISGFQPDNKELIYPGESISILLNTLREHKNYLEAESIRKWFE